MGIGCRELHRLREHRGGGLGVFSQPVQAYRRPRVRIGEQYQAVMPQFGDTSAERPDVLVSIDPAAALHICTEALARIARHEDDDDEGDVVLCVAARE